MGTQVEVKERTSTGNDEAQKIVVFNDDFNTFDHVIECFVAYCKHSVEQATQCAMIIHTKGKCDVKHGGEEELIEICENLIRQDLSAEIQ